MVEQLAAGSNVFDSEQPFMQRPALPTEETKIGAKYSTTAPDAVKKLSPGMPADESESFWDLLTAYPKMLNLAEALLKLTTYHYFSPAGNLKVTISYRSSSATEPISYEDKARMGAPGFHFPGAGNSATEFIWKYPDGTFLHSLLSSLPTDWINDGGLPAFADRYCNQSRTHDGSPTSLWAATWSSNTAIGYWEGTDLVQVRVCGVPEEWLPLPIERKIQAGNKIKFEDSTLKEWWDLRNTRDPFYFYVENAKGELKAQRLDIGRGPTDLSVEWYSLEKSEKLLDRSSTNLLPPRFANNDYPEPIFFRHCVQGTASSPVIRASNTFIPSREQWGFDLSEDQQNSIVTMAKLVRDLHRCVIGAFPQRDTKTPGGKARSQDARPILAGRYADASSEFWRNISAVYGEFIQTLRDGKPSPANLLNDLRVATLRTFDEITEPYLTTDAQQIFELRAGLVRRVSARVAKAKADGKATFTKDGE